MPNGTTPFGIIPFGTITKNIALFHADFLCVRDQADVWRRFVAERGGKEIFSGAFLDASQVFSAASVKKAVAKLERENIIYNYDGEYRFGSPFFCEWLLRR